MLSYLHAYHAGNFADVQKHAALVLALRMMQVKPSPIAFFDTHGGSASYDLRSERARKTAEADQGIQKLWPERKQLRSDDWIAFLKCLATGDACADMLTSYPGSPALFRQHLRRNDRLFAWELHPTEGKSLTDWAESELRIKAIQGDGLAGLVRQLPPSQPRLLVLTDPSYEVKSDYEQVADVLASAWKKCRHGVFMIWYPILPGAPHERLKATVAAGPVRKVLCQEIHRQTPPERGMSGSGLLVVNPPWGFDERLSQMMTDIAAPELLDVTISDQWLVSE